MDSETHRFNGFGVLDARFGFTDVCALDVTTKKTAKDVIPAIASGLPSDGYGRGADAPVLPNQPTLFYRAGVENICETVAIRVVDPDASVVVPNQKTWSSGAPDAAIQDFLGIVMALVPSDPRYTQAQSILSAHFASATKNGATPTDALRSTFVAACLAPSAVSIGM
jgi:hypothetical protein